MGLDRPSIFYINQFKLDQTLFPRYHDLECPSLKLIFYGPKIFVFWICWFDTKWWIPWCLAEYFVTDFKPVRLYFKELRLLFPIGKKRVSSIYMQFGLMKGAVGTERALKLSSEDLSSSLSAVTSSRDTGQMLNLPKTCPYSWHLPFGVILRNKWSALCEKCNINPSIQDILNQH